jgi:hypothetical protein
MVSVDDDTLNALVQILIAENEEQDGFINDIGNLVNPLEVADHTDTNSFNESVPE